MRSVAVVVSPGTLSNLLTTPHAVFGAATREGADYALTWVAEQPGPLTTLDGLQIIAEAGLEATASADLVVVPAWDTAATPSDALIGAIRAAHARGATIVGLCMGAFAVAASGVLGRRPAVTHWSATGLLAARHGVAVQGDPLWIDHGDVVTSAGATAAYDCCLHLVRAHHGAALAAATARRLVMAPHREGNQAQHATPAAVRPAAAMAHILDYGARHATEGLSVDAWARHAGMSRRTFTRSFRAATGTSPHAWLIARRVDAARELLECDARGIDQIASAVGFADASSLRHHFSARLGTTPSHYRRAFRDRPATSALPSPADVH